MFDKKAWSLEYNQRPEVQEANRKRARKWRNNHLEQARIHTRTWREKHPEQKQGDACDHKLWSRERHHLEKVRVVMYYSDPPGATICNNCGEQDIDVLCIDHVDGGGAKHRRTINIAGSNFYSWLIKNSFPEGYQVLCANCNIRKSKYV